MPVKFLAKWKKVAAPRSANCHRWHLVNFNGQILMTLFYSQTYNLTLVAPGCLSKYVILNPEHRAKTLEMYSTVYEFLGKCILEAHTGDLKAACLFAEDYIKNRVGNNVNGPIRRCSILRFAKGLQMQTPGYRSFSLADIKL